MKRDWIALTCVMIIGFVVWAERGRWMPAQVIYCPATPPPRHLSPEGTFYIVQYVSAHTQHGVAGFDPGVEVRLVSVNKSKGTLCVTDGKYQADVGPMQITNDLEVLAVAQRQDEESQRRLQDMLEAAHQEYDRSAVQANLQAAKEMAQVRSASLTGAGETIVEQKKGDHSSANGYYPSFYGSPYYYLARESGSVVATSK